MTDRCQHRWHLVVDEEDNNQWWVACESCGEYGECEDINNLLRDLRGALAECELDRAQADKIVYNLCREQEGWREEGDAAVGRWEGGGEWGPWWVGEGVDS